MSMLVIQRTKVQEYIVIPYRRPKWDSFHYASKPVLLIPGPNVEREVFNLLGADVSETKCGVEPDSLQKLIWSCENEEQPPANLTGITGHKGELIGWSKKVEKEVLTDSIAIHVGLKKIIGGYADIYRFSPCVISKRRLVNVLDKDPVLNIEEPYPMGFETFANAFRLAFERAND